MAAGPELRTYARNLDQAARNVSEVKDVVEAMGQAVDVLQLSIRAVDAIQEEADDFGKLIRNMQRTLDLMDKAGPLKPLARAAERVLDRVHDVAQQIERQAERLARKIDDAQLEDKLDKAEKRLDSYEDGLDKAGLRLTLQAASAHATVAALDGIDALDPAGDPAAGLSLAADLRVAPANAALGSLNEVYGAVRGAALSVQQAIPLPSFQPVLQVRVAFDHIGSSLDFLQGPLDTVGRVLRPVEGLLDAVGFIFDITVGPVIDFLMNSLGINRIVDDLAAQITARLPRVDALDRALAAIDGAVQQVDVLSAVDDRLGLTDWASDVLHELVDRVVEPAEGPLRIGADGAQTLHGTTGDDLLDGGPGNDTLLGEAGDDVLIAGPGNDVLDGGAGSDRAVFRGAFVEYQFSQTAQAGSVVFDHVRPANPRASDGRDELHDVETFVFADLTLTAEQLARGVSVARPGQAQLTGTEANDLLFGGSTALTIEGQDGNDLIVGSPRTDRLYGGKGDDLFVATDGDDLIDGGPGSDTWRFPVDNRSGNPNVDADLVEGRLVIGSQRLALEAVENLVVEDARSAFLRGDGQANRLAGAGGRDVLDGRDGDDRLEGGDANDVLIGGPGHDTLLGGAGNDVLVAGERSVDGGSDVYDGGEGDFDTLVYRSDLIDFLRQEHIDDHLRSIERNQEAAGPLRVHADTGEVVRLADDGRTVLAVDRVTGVEKIVGSDHDDEMWGASGPHAALDGGPGNDILYAQAAGYEVNGGEGDDRVVAGTGGAGLYGGGGYDVLDLAQQEGVRWLVRIDGSLGSSLRAFNALEGDGLATPGGSLRNDWGPAMLANGNVGDFDLMLGGPNDDYFELRGFGSLEVRSGAGNDELHGRGGGSNNPRFVFHGENGDDVLTMQDPGLADGGPGSDRVLVDAGASASIQVLGGDGDDVIELRGGRVDVDGGPGLDVLAAASRNPLVGLDVDLASGTVGSAATTQRVNGTVRNVEMVIGSDLHADTLRGGDSGDTLLGAGGADHLEGRAGNDLLYGGTGDDELAGGDGDDLLHGGPGNDRLDGGPGSDTASWSFATPGSTYGSVVAAGFGQVDADLGSGLARVTPVAGAVETDRLIGIENLVGGAGRDVLRGDGGPNLLSGGAGADLLDGRAGDDVLVLDGDDSALGGEGDDRFVVGPGRATIDGGAGDDVLDFGNLAGRLVVDVDAGTYAGTLQVQRPVWRQGGGSEPRPAGPLTLTPADVLQTDPRHADSSDDLAREVPAGPGFEIELVTVDEAVSGRFSGIESFVGGAADLQLLTSRAGLRVEGFRDGLTDVDMSRSATALDVQLGAAEGLAASRLTGGAFDDRLQAGSEAATLEGGAGNDTLSGGAGADRLDGGPGDDRLTGDEGEDQLDGGPGADLLEAGPGDDRLDGGPGLDRALVAGPRADFALDRADNGFVLRDLHGVQGVDTLVEVERLSFTDGGLALDLDGAAGRVAKLLGAVFGPAAVARADWVAIGLQLADAGADDEALGGLALHEAGATTPRAVVDLLWSHVVGGAPTAEQAAPFVALLEGGTSPGALAVMAAETAENAAHIDLVGLVDSGLPFG